MISILLAVGTLAPRKQFQQRHRELNAVTLVAVGPLWSTWKVAGLLLVVLVVLVLVVQTSLHYLLEGK